MPLSLVLFTGDVDSTGIEQVEIERVAWAVNLTLAQCLLILADPLADDPLLDFRWKAVLAQELDKGRKCAVNASVQLKQQLSNILSLYPPLSVREPGGTQLVPPLSPAKMALNCICLYMIQWVLLIVIKEKCTVPCLWDNGSGELRGLPWSSPSPKRGNDSRKAQRTTTQKKLWLCYQTYPVVFATDPKLFSNYVAKHKQTNWMLSNKCSGNPEMLQLRDLE